MENKEKISGSCIKHCTLPKIMLGDIMESELFIEDLFMKLQDKMEFDEDVEALFKILKNLLKTKKQKSEE